MICFFGFFGWTVYCDAFSLSKYLYYRFTYQVLYWIAVILLVHFEKLKFKHFKFDTKPIFTSNETKFWKQFKNVIISYFVYRKAFFYFKFRILLQLSSTWIIKSIFFFYCNKSLPMRKPINNLQHDIRR